MRYCTGCGGGVLKQPQALCEFDRPLFYFANLCSLGPKKKKKKDPHLMEKKKKKIPKIVPKTN